MFTCSDCKGEFTEADRSPWVGIERCLACMMRRFGIQQALESRRAIETSAGWATAQCTDGIPTLWLCLHLHATSDEAEECLAGRFKE